MKNKLFLLFLMLPFLFGYRVYPNGNTWKISKSDPYVFLDFCEDLNITANDVDSDDIASAYGSDITHTELVFSILTDFNSVSSQYLRLGTVDDGNFNAIADADNIITVCEGPQSGTAGYAQQKVDSEGRVIGCEITLGTFSDKAKTLAQILTHEIGHCLGLDHPQETSYAVMSYFSDYSKIYRLQGDDKAGLTYLYPSDSNYRRKMTMGASCSPQ